MGWICAFCETENDNSEKECIVCGKLKSETDAKKAADLAFKRKKEEEEKLKEEARKKEEAKRLAEEEREAKERAISITSMSSMRILPHCGIGTRTIYPGGISLWKGLRNCFGSSQGNTGCFWSPTVRPAYRKGDWRARASNRILRIFSYLRNWVRTSRTVVSLRPALPGSPLLTRSAASSSGTV